MLVVCMGAFTGMDLSDVTIDRLIRFGLSHELVTRFDQIIQMRELPEGEIVQLLKQHAAVKELRELGGRLGIGFVIHDETYSRAARTVAGAHDGSTIRTAVSWITNAMRRAIFATVNGHPSKTVAITPDSLAISPAATRPRRPDWNDGREGDHPA